MKKWTEFKKKENKLLNKKRSRLSIRSTMEKKRRF